MSKNLEIESKTLLDKETYEKMRAAFTAKSDFIQKNYYFDTPDFDLKNSDTSLRIRILVDHAEQTIKVKERRIFKKVETREEASEAVQEMQDEIYGNTGFKLASEL